ncbi:MAG: asparagine synthase-related protein [Pyrobaculum sp.]
MIIEMLSKYAECDAVLLSGGLDSSAVALAAVKRGLRPLAVTVSLGGCRRDLPYAQYVASALGLPHVVRIAYLEEALRAAEALVEVLEVFNPMDVVNCAVQHLAMAEAKEAGARTVCTGDGADELLLGYSFYQKVPPHLLEEKRREVVERWDFCGFKIGRRLGLTVRAPFTEEEAAKLLLAMPASHVLGKRPLREELRPHLPPVADREKTPMEAGSCFSELYAEMRRRAGDEVEYLRRIYHAAGLSYPKSPGGCPRCGYAYFQRYCKMCGYYV